MQMREFDVIAWGAFQGCVRWSDGRDPLIGTGRLDDGKTFALVLDPTGGCFTVLGHPVTDAGGWVLEHPFASQDAARAFGAAIPEPRSIDDVLRFGFREA